MRKTLLMITPENREIHNFRKRQFNNFIQLTMPYLAGFVDEKRYNLTLIDEYNQDIPWGKTFDLVAITVNTTNAMHRYAMADRFIRLGSKVALGGPHAALLPYEAKEHANYVFIGESEYTWPGFLDDFFQDRTRDFYVCDEIPSLISLPHPRRDLVKRRPFSRGALFATRGCPYQCTYCNLKQLYCNTFRTRPIHEVLEEIASLQSRYFVFWDDNFWGDANYAKELMTGMKGMKKKWAAQVTIDKCRDKEILKIARAAGCIYLFLGLESFSNESLLKVNKGFNRVEEYEDIIRNIHQAGISVQAGIIFGFDNERSDIFARTLDICELLGLDGATASIMTPYPGTPIYDELKESNRLHNSDWEAFNGKTRVAFKPLNMSETELYEGYMWFRRNFYSLRSIAKRLTISKTNVLSSLITNLGYKFSLTVR